MTIISSTVCLSRSTRLSRTARNWLSTVCVACFLCLRVTASRTRGSCRRGFDIVGRGAKLLPRVGLLVRRRCCQALFSKIQFCRCQVQMSYLPLNRNVGFCCAFSYVFG